jgi:hypothetical protein
MTRELAAGRSDEPEQGRIIFEVGTKRGVQIPARQLVGHIRRLAGGERAL